MLLEHGRRLENSPLFLSAAVVAMILLFTFGLPGSLGLWLIAPFNPPLLSTALLVLAFPGTPCDNWRERWMSRDNPAGALHSG